MELSQDVLLPILFVTVAANVAIVAVLLASGRIGRRKGVAAAGPPTTTFEDTIMSTSYSDRSASASWPPPSASGPFGNANERPEPEPEPAAAEPAVPEPVVPEPFATPTAGSFAAPPVAPAPEPAPDVEEGIDPLTGLPDGTAFHRLIADEDARIARYRHPATVVVFELEGLDRLVERLGQDAGDRVIPPVADTIRRLARGADHVARVGPGRFAALLPETDEVAAINYVERVRRACEMWLESGAMALRLAIGWAGTTGDPSLTDTLRLATERMYVEMRRGARLPREDTTEPGI